MLDLYGIASKVHLVYQVFSLALSGHLHLDHDLRSISLSDCEFSAGQVAEQSLCVIVAPHHADDHASHAMYE